MKLTKKRNKYSTDYEQNVPHKMELEINQQLFDTEKDGNEEKVKDLLEKRADPNSIRVSVYFFLLFLTHFMNYP